MYRGGPATFRSAVKCGLLCLNLSPDKSASLRPLTPGPGVSEFTVLLTDNTLQTHERHKQEDIQEKVQQ